MDLSNYLPVLLFLFVGSLVGIGPMVIGKLLGPSRPDPEKLSAYECGFEAFGDARMQVDIRYYLVAILFILFDLEIAFLFPWAVSLGCRVPPSLLPCPGPSWLIPTWLPFR